MNNNILEIKKKITFILKRHNVKKAAIFGSVGRGDFKKTSDVDILIEFKNSKDKSLLDLVSLKLDLEEALKKKVDVVEYSAIKPILKKSILENQALVL
jgi:predicted nucleotidyltransferase